MTLASAARLDWLLPCTSMNGQAAVAKCLRMGRTVMPWSEYQLTISNIAYPCLILHSVGACVGGGGNKRRRVSLFGLAAASYETIPGKRLSQFSATMVYLTVHWQHIHNAAANISPPALLLDSSTLQIIQKVYIFKLRRLATASSGPDHGPSGPWGLKATAGPICNTTLF